ncbi:MAG TPA: hypothetical protein VG317_15180 [Pseudonocardiaceae bacterium]|nr:hypothetical protein [Pseudonocardiaceae bacterium]
MTKLASRALLVLGGAVAATAACWAISSATASADTLPGHVPANPAGIVTTGGHAGSTLAKTDPVSTTERTVQAAVNSVARTVNMVTAPLAQPAMSTWPTAWRDGWNQVTGSLQGTVTQLGHDSLAKTTSQLVAGSPAVSSLAQHASAGQSAVPSAVTTAPLTAPHSATTVTTTALPTGHHAADSHRFPTTPGAPRAPGRAPAAPVNAPSSGTTGGAGGSSGPGGPAGVGAGASYPVLPGVSLIGVSAPKQPLAHLTAGKQPGVTPD